MRASRIIPILPAVLILLVAVAPAKGYVAHESHIFFLDQVTKDIMKLLPRSMGYFIYQNRYDFNRGLTFMTRQIRGNPSKFLDIEEVRNQAFPRLNRDIPYCVQAFKSGEIKLDTSASNLAGRLGIIAYSIILVNFPDFPDYKNLEHFSRVLDQSIVDRLFNIWIYYDGYGDFNSLGELTERFRSDRMPEFRPVRNLRYSTYMREDPYVMFRAPEKFHGQMVLTNADMNEIYSDIINDIVDTFMYIWKCSGMDLAHPSYSAPPGTVISRISKRREVTGGVLTMAKPKPPSAAVEPISTTEELPEAFEEAEPGEPPSSMPKKGE